MTAPQPTLTDGVVTVRPWHQDATALVADLEQAVAGHDQEIRHWFGQAEGPTVEHQRTVVERWRGEYADGGRTANFVIEADGRNIGGVELRRQDQATGALSWWLYAGARRQGYATRAVRVVADWALTEETQGGAGLSRIEAEIEPGNQSSLRVATRSGLRREGVRRVVAGTGDRPETTQYVVHARLATDPPLSEPESFRALLNSFLPRKRAISQLLVRAHDDRVLLCQLTYKTDWDLPGGVVEVGESPQLAAAREVAEELGIEIPAGDLLITDWLPPWGGWDDALCLVFDGGHHDPAILAGLVRQEREIRTAEFCTLEQVDERCRDFTARRIRSALGSRGSTYTESGRGPS